MDSIDGTNGMDNMDTAEFDQPGSGSGASASGAPPPRRLKWSGRTKRVVTSVAASTLLLGGGAAIGVALTGGASAATGGTSPATVSNAAATATTASSLAGRCARLALRLQHRGHPVAATHLRGLCRDPLRRLLLVGGEHGELTFQTKAGPKTIAFERGTIQSISSSGITVQAKDGTTWTWDYVTNTAVRQARQAVSRNSLTTGETVLVVGPVVSGVHDARLIRIRAGK